MNAKYDHLIVGFNIVEKTIHTIYLNARANTNIYGFLARQCMFISKNSSSTTFKLFFFTYSIARVNPTFKVFQ